MRSLCGRRGSAIIPPKTLGPSRRRGGCPAPPQSVKPHSTPTQRKAARGRASKYSTWPRLHGKRQKGVAQPFRRLWLSAQLQVALGTADECMKAGFIAALDGEVDAYALQCCGKFVRLRAQDFKIVQGALCGCVFGGVDRVGAPFHKEGEETVAVVGEVDGFPVENAAIRTLSGAVVWPLEFDFVFAELFGDGADVRRVDGPANEARVGH